MGDSHQYDPYGHRQAATPSRAGMRSSGTAGEIVEVQGGHIVRSTGRKDRHSKVCTAKGPRDRRVRLSAHTAIQFYDVQDRLGYDRPSKAVDWLIKKAKTAIDDLAELPAWKPTATAAAKTRSAAANPPTQPREEEETLKNHHHQQQEAQRSGSSSGRDFNSSPVDSFTFQHQLNPSACHLRHHHYPGSGFMPPSLDSDAIADTIKSFFPIGSSGGGCSSVAAPSLNLFQSYPVPDLLSRTSSSGRTQDLRLSLHSMQEQPILEPQHHPHMFPGTTAHFLGFDGPSSSSSGGWPEHHQQFQRMVASWSGDNPGGGGGFILNSIPQAAAEQLAPSMLFGQNQLLISQRGPLQSSNSPSVRAWVDPAADQIPHIHSGMGFSAGGFSGFRVPARIQGDEEEHDGIHNKPSSTSSDSRH